MPLPSQRRRLSPRLVMTFACVAFAGVVWFALGMQRGLLLSNDVLTVRYPWAALFREHGVQSPELVDPVQQFVPWLQLARREILAGRLPLWNPYQDGGVPLLGNPQTALGSPLTWPVLALGVAAGWNPSLLLRVVLAAVGTFLLARELGHSRWAACLSGLIFALAGQSVAWLENTVATSVVPVPLLAYAVLRLAHRVTPRSVAGVAGAAFLVLAGGHPETAVLGAALVLALAAAGMRTCRGWRAAGLGGALGLCVWAPFLLAFAEYFRESLAALGIGRDHVPFPIAALTRLVLPRYAIGNSIETAAFVSITGVLLVGVAVVMRYRERVTRWLTGIAVVIVLLVYSNPLSTLLASLRGPYWTRALALLPIPLGLLAGGGLDAIRARVRREWRAGIGAAALAIVGVELVLAAQGVHGVTSPDMLRLTTPLLAKLQSEPGPTRILPLGVTLPPNLATSYGLEDVRGYDAITPRGWREQRERIGHFRNDTLRAEDLVSGGGALDAWSVTHLIAPPGPLGAVAELNRKMLLDLVEVYNGPDGRLWRNRRALPRVRLASGGTVEIEERTPTRWRLSAQASAQDALTVANPYFPGWRAWVDGDEVALRLCPGEPLVLPLARGQHRIDLVYRPRSLALGVIISVLALAALGLMCIRGRP